ncbi:MAG TPA: alpha/beta fold hydrolase [Solirubrobacterales bacterium]|jgi:pimeloyl-ACP methyl ester carboxylesterase|nr:alpha/beta fold hydrolase [Solirubrobacterales bacterium]
MGRGWKIACGVVLALFALVVVNTLVVDADTDGATVTVPGGRILELPGGDIQVVDRGPRSGDPIVLVHCFSCAMDYWDGMLPALAAKHRVIAVDLRGHGGSEKPSSGYSVPEQADFVAEALRALQVSDAEVVGHSLGGAVSVALAEQAPALVDRVAIVDMPPDGSYGGLGFIAGLAFQPVLGEALWTIKPDFSVRKGLEVAFAPGYDVPDAFVDDVNRLTYTAYDESPARVDDYFGAESLDRRMRATGKPLMVLMGAEEQVVNDPERALAQYAGTVPGTETHLIAGAGHSPNVEKPTQSARLVLAFANSP